LMKAPRLRPSRAGTAFAPRGEQFGVRKSRGPQTLRAKGRDAIDAPMSESVPVNNHKHPPNPKANEAIRTQIICCLVLTIVDPPLLTKDSIDAPAFIPENSPTE
jgi:hypothetical protein